MTLDVIGNIYREATRCRICFESGCAYSGNVCVKLAQPRPVGQRYFSARRRVLVVLVNPGAVGEKDRGSADKLTSLLERFRDGQIEFAGVNDHLTADMVSWGIRRSVQDRLRSFCRFYFEDMGLDPEQTAFVNIGLCGAKKQKNGKEENAYPPCLLRNCFAKYSSRLISAFDPELCVVSGTPVWDYADPISNLLPNAVVCRANHYAFRTADKENALASAAEVKRRLQDGHISRLPADPKSLPAGRLLAIRGRQNKMGSTSRRM